MKKFLTILCYCMLVGNIQAQELLNGTVMNELEEPLFGATLIWAGAESGTVADENGAFYLHKQDTIANLYIDYVGYQTMVVEVLPSENDLVITLDGVTDLMPVEVAAKKRDNYVSTLSTLNVESIGAGELRKAPCCNLAESFSTNAAVDVAYSDAVTGAREIMMLGLRGSYTQMMIEKRPAMTGLGSAFSLEYLPGTWLSGIQISKGTGTVQNGYQSIAGQINSELVKPFEDKKVFLNLYGSTFGRGEANLHLNHKVNEKLSSGLLLHASTRRNELDGNDDGFYDTPQKDMLDGMFRMFYRGDVFRSQINIHAIRDRHVAGQIPTVQSQNRYYVITQDHDRVELFAKAGYLGFENLNNTVGFILNASWHNLDSWYSERRHYGTQKNAYVSGLFSTALKNSIHKIDVGASYLYDDYDEWLYDYREGVDSIDLSRTESVPGAFVEYRYAPEFDEQGAFKNRLGATVGVRVDQHNIYGTLFTPRANVKYNFSENSIVRVSAGRGFRVANVIAENVGMLASNRVVYILENPEIEEAWNIGLNFTQNFELAGKDGSFSFDLYRTEFVNQIVMDMDERFDAVYFYNLNGRSFANSLLSVFSYEILDGLDFKVGYKFNDVRMSFQDGELRSKPMVPQHRGLITLDYKTTDEKWAINTGLQLVGKSRFVNLLENIEHNDAHYTGETDAYALVSAQLTRKFGKNFEVYLGGENLTNYTQKDPIIDAEDPFGDYFDATHIYAPITGAMGYIGIRWGIE